MLGSASMAAFIAWRLTREMPPAFTDATRAAGGVATATLPESLRAPFAEAMSQSMMLPAVMALYGVVAALLLVEFRRS